LRTPRRVGMRRVPPADRTDSRGDDLRIDLLRAMD
jgi:hypothetical protein